MYTEFWLGNLDIVILKTENEDQTVRMGAGSRAYQMVECGISNFEFSDSITRQLAMHIYHIHTYVYFLQDSYFALNSMVFMIIKLNTKNKCFEKII
jgi:hypothetical protein